MIILDTNIISELMKNSPSLNVMRWLDRQDITCLFITTITIAEISYGIGVLPEGKRKVLLESAFNQAIHAGFKHRIIDFDEVASYAYGRLMSQRKALGKPLGILDGQIAAIAAVNHATVATRNLRDFRRCGLELVDPFDE